MTSLSSISFLNLHGEQEEFLALMKKDAQISEIEEIYQSKVFEDTCYDKYRSRTT